MLKLARLTFLIAHFESPLPLKSLFQTTTMPGPWNDTTDRLLLLSIIHLTAPQLPKWDEVAKMMGPGFTAASTR